MNNLIDAPTSLTPLQNEFQAQCAIFTFKRMMGTPLYPRAIPEPLAGLYSSALQSLTLQLATKTIRSCITWRSFKDSSTPYGADFTETMQIYPFWIILKKCIDGYNLKGGRNIILSTLSNISIWGAEHTIDAADIHYMVDCEETRYSRSITDQMSSQETLTLGILGFPDIETGFPVNVTTVECEDSKSMQLAVGRGGPTSNSRVIFTRYPWSLLSSKWKTVFSPISFASYGAHSRWVKFRNSVLIPKCGPGKDFPNVEPDLLPFAKTQENKDINEHADEYRKAYKWLTTKFCDAELQVSDWACGQGMRTKAVEPLHCILRVCVIVLKYYHLHVIEYSKCIGRDSDDGRFFAENNHSRQHAAHDFDFIMKHIKDCLGIPFTYVEESPTLSSIKADGTWRRRLWDHLEDVVCCEKCGFRPWKDSDLEAYWMVFFVNLVEVLTPLELLDHRMYAKYWKKYLQPRFVQNMDVDAESFNYETATIWNIYAQHFYILYMKLIGSNHLTRYIHGVVFATAHGHEIAYALQTTYRALFGSDVVERMNSLTKTILHTASSKLGGRYQKFPVEMVENTIGQIMKWSAWDRYRFRETSPRMNLKYRLNKFLRDNQLKSDLVHLTAANRMRKRILAPGRPFSDGLSLTLDCPVSNEYQRIGIFHLIDEDALDINIPSENEVQYDAQQESIRSGLREMLMGFQDFDRKDAVNDDNTDRDDNWNIVTADDEFEFDQTKLKRRFSKLEAIAFSEKQSADGIDRSDEQKVSDAQCDPPVHSSNPFACRWVKRNVEYVLNWNPIHELRLKSTDFNFGADWIRLRTEVRERRFVQSSTDATDETTSYEIRHLYRMTWKYHTLFRITTHHSDHCLAIWMKMAAPPDVEERRGPRDWQTVSVVPQYLQQFMSNGKIGLFLNNVVHEREDVDNLVRHWKYFSSSHQIPSDEYVGIRSDFCDEEKNEAMAAFQLTICPVMQLHSRLVADINELMAGYRKGEKRRCLSCEQYFGIFDSHSLCLGDSEEVDNISKHVFDRLRLKGVHLQKTGSVVIVKDPIRSRIDTPGRTVIQEDREFWGSFVLAVYMQMVRWLQRFKKNEFVNCRVDADYKKLVCPVTNALRLFDIAMEITRKRFSRNPLNCSTKREAIRKLISAVSNLFIMPRSIQRELRSLQQTRKISRHRRLKIWKRDDFCLRFRHHFVVTEICSCKFVIDILSNYSQEIYGARKLWHF